MNQLISKYNHLEMNYTKSNDEMLVFIYNFIDFIKLFNYKENCDNIVVQIEKLEFICGNFE